MTKIFVLGGNFKPGSAFLGGEVGLGGGEGTFLQHSEGGEYLDTNHCHGERDIFALEDESLDVYTSLSATY